MFAVKEGWRKVDEKNVPTFKRDTVSACVMSFEAGTNGPKGGDAGHGGRTYVRIANEGGACINASVLHGPYNGDGVEITLAGDCEMRDFLQGLKFIVRILSDQIRGKDWHPTTHVNENGEIEAGF